MVGPTEGSKAPTPHHHHQEEEVEVNMISSAVPRVAEEEKDEGSSQRTTKKSGSQLASMEASLQPDLNWKGMILISTIAILLNSGMMLRRISGMSQSSTHEQ